MSTNFDIYFATKRLSIAQQPFEGCGKIVELDELSSITAITELLGRYASIVVVTPDPQQALCRISSLFRSVLAAGGIAKNAQGEELMIFRGGRWDLPKGHHEQGESIEECAVREVEEETGVVGLTIGEKLCVTLHAYYLRSVWELKSTHWYSMSCEGTPPLKPQYEEGIEDVRWCTAAEVEKNLEGSFPTIKAVFAANSVNH